MNCNDLANLFAYHPANDARKTLHEKLRSDVRTLAVSFNADLPESREKSLAITYLQTALMFANAAVAIHDQTEDASPLGEEDPNKAVDGGKPAEHDFRTKTDGKAVDPVRETTPTDRAVRGRAVKE